MVLNGFELVKTIGVMCCFGAAAALSSMGGKVIKIIGYIASTLIVAFFIILLVIAFTIEPNSSAFLTLLFIAILGVIMGLLSILGIHSLAIIKASSEV